MRILVFGAGPLGSLMAARLQQGGQDVTLLAGVSGWLTCRNTGSA